MKPIELPKVPELPDIKPYSGIQDALKKSFRYLHDSRAALSRFSIQSSKELTPLYGEYVNSSPGGVNDGAQSVLTVTVDGAIAGFCVDVSYDRDLQGLQATAYVSADDTVKIILKNDTGGTITLTAGVFRVYVWPRLLSDTTP